MLRSAGYLSILEQTFWLSDNIDIGARLCYDGVMRPLTQEVYYVSISGTGLCGT